MADELVALLMTEGPCLSGELADKLCDALGISPAAARKKIERRSDDVRALELPFPRKAKFLYLRKQYSTPLFWKRLATALAESNGAYARAIRALNARDGVIQRANFAAAAASSNGTRQISAEDVIQRLVSATLLQELDVPGLGPCVGFRRGDAYIDERIPAIRARLIAEEVLLQSVQEWGAKLGLGSFHSFMLRTNVPGLAPTVSNFEWDLTAPSFLGPLATWADASKPKPGFFAVDVLLKEEVSADDIQPFVYKCTALRQLRGVGRCLQFFVAHRYSREALSIIRQNGIVAATPESLFGTDVARALAELTGTLKQAATQSVDPEKFATLFEKLGKSQGAVGTLRGALFEYLVADVIRHTVAGVDITMNKIYRWNGKDVAEVDVRAVVKDREIRFIECKGLLPGRQLSEKDVDDWLVRRIPAVRKQTLENPEWKNIPLKFEMWLTGELSPESKARVEAAKAEVNPERYTIDVHLASDIEKMVEPLPALRKVVTQHFLRHPLAAQDDVINPLSKRRINQVEAKFAHLAQPAEDES
ncbi:hypothetical protein AB4Y45_22910 [Paraburkholderia sp. EG287A]|uniref:hypothetical protein n=1 Tax=Paraburkholderia sp. EG287A TaxID=3237012 RepID=UPI0034D351E8